MYTDAIGVKPVEFDFSKGYTETWDLVYPSFDGVSLAECHDYLDDKGADMPDPNPWEMDRDDLAEALTDAGIEVYDHETVDVLRAAVIANIDDGTIDGIDDWREKCRDSAVENPDEWTPMMNYYYPLPRFEGDAGKAQLTVSKTGCCVVVTIGDETALALSGGGMDLSWDICRAYIALNYYPPVHFCDLPNQGETDTAAVIAACKESCNIQIRWTQNTLESLTRLEQKHLAGKE
jgi:hypothetical protein